LSGAPGFDLVCHKWIVSPGGEVQAANESKQKHVEGFLATGAFPLFPFISRCAWRGGKGKPTWDALHGRHLFWDMTSLNHMNLRESIGPLVLLLRDLWAFICNVWSCIMSGCMAHRSSWWWCLGSLALGRNSLAEVVWVDDFGVRG